MIKVFFLNNALTPYIIDAFNRINQLKGIELVVIVPGNESSMVGKGVYQTKENIKFRVIELEEKNNSLGYLSFKNLGRLIWEEKPQVIIGLESYLFTVFYHPVLRMITKLLGIRLLMKSIPMPVLSYDDAKIATRIPIEAGASLKAKLKRRLGNIRRRIFLELSRHFYRKIDTHLTYIEEGIPHYLSYGVKKEQILVIYNSPDTDKLLAIRKAIDQEEPILPPNPHRLIHVGRLVEWKRVDLIIQAVQSLQNKFPDIELLVVGFGPEEKEWKALAQKLKVESRIRFLGGVYDQHLLGKYYRSSSVYVLGGMGGLSINEAMCFELPVLCSVCDGTEKQLVRNGETGFFFKNGDASDLANKMSSLFSDPESAKMMGKNALRTIETKINIHLLIRGYEQAIRGRIPEKN